MCSTTAIRRASSRVSHEPLITFALEINKLLDEPLWIRESNQVAARNYVWVGLQACTRNALLKFQREKPVARRSDHANWYWGPAAEVAALSKNDFRFVTLARRCGPQDLLRQIMQKIRFQIEFGAVAGALSGRNPCPCGARVLPPIPSSLARQRDHCIDEN